MLAPVPAEGAWERVPGHGRGSTRNRPSTGRQETAVAAADLRWFSATVSPPSVAFGCAENTEILGPVATVGLCEAVRCQTALEQLADRRSPAWHAPLETPVVQGSQLRLRKHDLEALTSRVRHGLALCLGIGWHDTVPCLQAAAYESIAGTTLVYDIEPLTHSALDMTVRTPPHDPHMYYNTYIDQYSTIGQITFKLLYIQVDRD